MTLTFSIQGDPIPKGRPRFGNGRTYTSARTQAFERAAGWDMKAAMAGKPPFDCPLNVLVTFIYSIPPSWSKTKRRAALLGEQLPVGTADIDNTMKSVFDAGNEIVWTDDRIICRVTAQKKYGPQSMTVITVEPIGAP